MVAEAAAAVVAAVSGSSLGTSRIADTFPSTSASSGDSDSLLSPSCFETTISSGVFGCCEMRVGVNPISINVARKC